MTAQRDVDGPTPPERGLFPPPPDSSPPHDGLLLPLVHELVQPYVERARQHGPTPGLRTDEWLDAHPDQQIAHILICGMAAILNHPHDTTAALLKGAGRDVSAAIADQADYITPWTRVRNDLRRANDHADRLAARVVELEARRAAPTVEPQRRAS